MSWAYLLWETESFKIEREREDRWEKGRVKRERRDREDEREKRESENGCERERMGER